MKKILSALLVLAMLASLVIVATLPAAAVNGEWSVYTWKTNDFEEDDDKNSVPGYEYTTDGLHVIAPTKEKDPNWRTYATVQTTEMQDLRDGIYMQVRVDAFDYTAGDKWFSFHVWDDHAVEPGKVGEVNDGEDYGFGVEMLMRFGTSNNETVIGGMNWYRDFDDNSRDEVKLTGMQQSDYIDATEKDADGHMIMTLSIQYSADDEIYIMTVNGITAPDGVNEDMTAYFDENCNGKAYIGFSLQNSTAADQVDFTVIKYGTSESDATVPVGDDKRDAKIYSSQIAPIDSSAVEDGMPAIIISGDTDVSNHKKISSVTGSTVELTEDGTIKVSAKTSSTIAVDCEYSVSNSVSRDARDFPYVMIITKNLCTCAWTDTDGNGTIDDYEKVCNGNEDMKLFYRAGSIITDTSGFGGKYQPSATQVGSAQYSGDDIYSCWIVDLTGCFSDDNGNATTELQRIHGGRVDVYNIKTEAGRNSFEICELAYFASEDSIESYFTEYINNLDDESGDDIGGETTNAPVDDVTESDTESTIETEAKTEVTDEETTAKKEEQTTKKEEQTTKKEEQTTKKEEQTTKKEEQTTKKEEQTTKKEEQTTKKDEEKKSGCGSVAGVGAIAVVAVAAAGLISFKKKKED